MSNVDAVAPLLKWLGLTFSPTNLSAPSGERGRLRFLKTVNEPLYLVSTSPLIPVWPAPLRLLFRFAFVYFLYFIIAETLPLPNGWVQWTALHILHWHVAPGPDSGSGDSAWSYAANFCGLALSLGLAALWSFLDWRRKQYVRLHELLRLAIRLALFLAMLSYGSFKVYPDQFGTLSLHRLVQPYGQSSPMGLLWTFMAASPTYAFFGGAAEILGGLLLATRRTTLLGALVCAAVMLNVFMLNLSYDVPVKLYSGHLLAMSLFLALPDAGRLLSVFVLNRPAPAAPIYPVFQKRWLNNLLLLGAAYFVWSSLHGALDEAALLHRNMTMYKPPLYGIWDVDTTNDSSRAYSGSVVPTNDSLWKRIIIDNFGYAGVIPTHTDILQAYKLDLEPNKQTMTLTAKRPPAKGAYHFFYQKEADRLTMTGRVSGHLITMKLHRVDETKMILLSRKFHWINETPFNR